jgi:hypothetical protein
MKKLSYVGMLLLVFSLGLGAQTIEEQELRGDFGSIEFISYVGPNSVINTREQIRGIGRSLGSQILLHNAAGGRYRVIRINPDETPGLAADILILSDTAGVDTIVNLNRIVAGYLETAFSYTPEKADVIANYITRYNAFYRGNMEFFGSKYMDPVVEALDSAKAGLDVAYFNWPGKTQIVIPLQNSLSKGPSGSVDSQEITNEEITQEVLEEENGIEEQKEVVNIIEEELAEEEQAIEEKEQELEEREEVVNEEIQNLEETREEIEENPNLTKEEKEEQLEVVEEQIQELEQEQEQIQEEREEVQEFREELENREQTLEESRETIAQEEQNQQNNSSNETTQVTETAAIRPVYFLMVNSGSPLGQLVIWDLNSARVVTRSALNSIRGRTYQFFGSDILVLAGRDGTDGAARLYLLERDGLTSSVEGQTNVFPDSKVVQNGSDIYAVLQNDAGDYVVGRFNGSLVLQTQSSLSVLNYTPIEISDGVIFVQGANGDVVRLNPSTLEEITD